LWSTPYGITLIVKLAFVIAVFALGAWNWRRQRPMLGTEPAAAAIRRSAAAELTVAGVVLVITSLLVSLPSPRPPGAAPRTAQQVPRP
jgi:copper transport protein